METGPLAIVLDNPIVVKHLRSRLRPNAAIAWLGGVVLVCVAIVWGNYFVYGSLGVGQELQWLLALQIYLLALQGTVRAGAAVGGARESGIFEYHRLSPLPPSWIGLGFLLGAPVREWLLGMAIVPFAFLASRSTAIGVGGFLAFEVPLVLGSLILHALAVLVALVSRKPKGNAQGSTLGIGIMGMAFGWPMTMGLNMLVGYLCDPTETRTFAFYGRPLHWLAFLTLYQGAALGFALLAVVRKAASDSTRALSKPEALACMATAAVLAVGATWGYRDEPYAVIALLYGLVVASAFLVATVAVDRGEYVRGLKRAWRQGRRRPWPWTADASSQWVVYAIAAVVAVAGSVAWERNLGPSFTSIAVALAVFTTAELGLGYQYARLSLGRYGGFALTLFVIVTWLVPLGVAGLLAVARVEPSTLRIAAAVSPLAGPALTGDPGWSDGVGLMPVPSSNRILSGSALELAAILPTLFLASLFNLLLIVCQRKLDRDVRYALAKAARETAAPAGD